MRWSLQASWQPCRPAHAHTGKALVSAGWTGDRRRWRLTRDLKRYNLVLPRYTEAARKLLPLVLLQLPRPWPWQGSCAGGGRRAWGGSWSEGGGAPCSPPCEPWLPTAALRVLLSQPLVLLTQQLLVQMLAWSPSPSQRWVWHLTCTKQQWLV